MMTVTGPLRDDTMIPTIKAKNEQTIRQNMDQLFEQFRQMVADKERVISELQEEIKALRAVAGAADKVLLAAHYDMMRGWQTGGEPMDDIAEALNEARAAGYLEARP